MPHIRFRRQLAWVLLIAPLAGCTTDLGYLLHVTGGELASLAHTRKIECALADPAVTPEQKNKLRLVQHLRNFARDRIGLKPADAFTLYEDNGNGPAAFAVSAAAKDALEPVHFTFPFVGQYDAKGFFDRGLAEQEKARLDEKGYDTFLGQVEGFSTMGLLPDPIRASNLMLDDASLAEFVLHELTHNTIFKANDTDFNESMATFVGRAAAQRYFDETNGPASPEAAAARASFNDEAAIDGYVVELYRKLADFYAQPISSEAKIAGRQAVMDDEQRRFRDDILPTLNNPSGYAAIGTRQLNNAIVLVGTRYQAGLDLYQAVFDKLGGDFAGLLDVLRQAAAQKDSRAFLQAWLAGSP